MKFFDGIFGDKTSEEKPSGTTLLDEYYRQKSKESADKAWNLLHSADWKLEKQNREGDTVYSKHLPGVGKVFKLQAEVNFPPKKLLYELFHNVETCPKWNPTILVTKRIKMLDDSTDVIYQVTAPAAGGLVNTRDFVSARHYYVRDGCFWTGGASVVHPEAPLSDKHVRGENGPGCMVAKPIPGVTDRCIFQWVINTRLNGWLPQYVVDMAFTDAMLSYVKYIRAHGEKLREQGLMDK